MTYKQFVLAREARLWISQVVLPTIGVGATVLALCPELRTKTQAKVKDVFSQTKSKIYKL